MSIEPTALRLEVARCHEIQSSLGNIEVPEFDGLSTIGMTVTLAQHIQGLPLLDFKTIKLVASHYLKIHALVVEPILRILAEIDFVKLGYNGKTIKSVLPTVPYYDDFYDGIGEYLNNEIQLNEQERLAVVLVEKLSRSPDKVDRIFNELGAERRNFDRNLDIGITGNYYIKRKCRGTEILLSPTYFSENGDIFADQVAKSGAKPIQEVVELLKKNQGWPLALIQQSGKVGTSEVTKDQVSLLRRLAEDGIVKPPIIETGHAGKNFFMFSPTPGDSKIAATKRDIYEKAMAIVAAVRQGQLLAKEYKIRSPGAVLYKLKGELQLSPTKEYKDQYRNLVNLRVGHLVDMKNGYFQFRIIDTPPNRDALNIAYQMVNGKDTPQDLAIDDGARQAMQQEQTYVESIIASGELRKRSTLKLSDEQQHQVDSILLGGIP